MDRDDDFLTATMAKVYTDQGHYLKAAEIYRQLIQKEPGRTDLVEALAQLEQKIKKEMNDQDKLVPLFSKWFELLLRYNRVKYLKKVRNKL